jgi:hypothetical protein
MYRLDMKPDLCDNAVAILPRGRRREVLSNALLWLLDKQWISTKMHTGRCFKVCRGSGMGLVHSSGVCDAALFSWLNSPGQRRWKCNQPLQYMLTIAFNMTSGFWQGIVLLPGVLSVVSGTWHQESLKASW